LLKNSKVSIGMPVYNGGKSLRTALNSLLSQTYRDFELIISDNASSDQTESICREYLKTDERIKYFRQKKTTYVNTNFQIVLDQSVGEYFMWAAADDYWFPDFIKENLQKLQKNDHYAGSISKVMFKDKPGNVYPSFADSEIVGSTLSRIKFFLREPGDNSRIYSIFRKKCLKDIKFNKYRFHASDHFYMYKILLSNELTSINKVLMYREKPENLHYVRSYKKDNSNWLTFGLPLLPLTLNIIFATPINLLVKIIPEIVHMNLKKTKNYKRMSREMHSLCS
jgi:glycosyltransferase involved in cell wall biosynthesis